MDTVIVFIVCCLITPAIGLVVCLFGSGWTDNRD